MAQARTVVVGAGIFGVAAALELRRRGRDVVLIDPGPLPHPLAASTDISKVIRLDYGPDEDYTMLAERALVAWREWSSAWPTRLFHETGILFVRRTPMAPGTFEHESFELLRGRGHTLERLDAAEIARRFPAWSGGGYVDGYFNPAGGWAESGRVVSHLLERARVAGVVLREGTALERLIERGQRVEGVVVRRAANKERFSTEDVGTGASPRDAGYPREEGRIGGAGTRFSGCPAPEPAERADSAISREEASVSAEHDRVGSPRLASGSGLSSARANEDRILADEVVLCAGAWTPHLVPSLAGVFRSSGLPVFHLRPTSEDLFKPERFPVFCADISETGYYGFPLHPSGVVKVANHGRGRAMHPESPERAVTAEETQALRGFLARSLGALAEAPIAATRICLYCDTLDGHLWIARDPDREGLTIAAGDSGHGFKFAPILGGLIADAAEGRDAPLLRKFRWRPEIRPPRSEEAARHQEP